MCISIHTNIYISTYLHIYISISISIYAHMLKPKPQALQQPQALGNLGASEAAPALQKGLEVGWT